MFKYKNRIYKYIYNYLNDLGYIIKKEIRQPLIPPNRRLFGGPVYHKNRVVYIITISWKE